MIPSNRLIMFEARIEKLFKKYYVEDYNILYKELIDIANYTREILATEFNPKEFGFYFTNYALKHLLKSYYYDIIRYKEFHFPIEDLEDHSIHNYSQATGSGLDRVKQASYLIKWIVRFKPICILNTVEAKKRSKLLPKQEKFIHIVNEIYAVIVAGSIVKYECKAESFNALVYQLHYRPYDEGLFEQLLIQLKKS